MTITVSFEYRNHNGKRSKRTVDLECLEFIGTINFGYQPGWFLSGICHDKNARRSFALSHITFEDVPSTAQISRLRFVIPLEEKTNENT